MIIRAFYHIKCHDCLSLQAQYRVNKRQIQNQILGFNTQFFFSWRKVKKSITLALVENKFLLFNQGSGFKLDHVYREMNNGLHDIPRFWIFDTGTE